MGQGINVQVSWWHLVILCSCQYTQATPTLEIKHKYVGHRSQIQACFRSDLCSVALPPHFSQDYFKHFSLSKTLFLLSMLLRSSLLFLCQRNVNFHKWFSSKTPLHIKISSALYCGQYLFWGRWWLLFQSAHFLMRSNSFEFSLF